MKKVRLYEEFNASINENYEVIFSDGVSKMKKFRSEAQALDFMKKEIKSNKKLRDIAVYKPGMHSTTQTEYVVAFWGDRSYLDNVSKKDPKLAAKKLEESVITEAKKFYNTKEISKMSNIAGDIVVDAKYAIQDLGVEYGNKVPAKELNKVLTEYDLELKDVMESVVNEAKAWDKLNKKAEEVYGEFGFASLDIQDMSKHIDMKKADKLADKMFGEFGFASLTEEEMEELINKNPKLVKESANVTEKKADGTISDDEDERREELLKRVKSQMEELLASAEFDANDIGGSFRAPGIMADIRKELDRQIKRFK
jgi:hypothetical protein